MAKKKRHGAGAVCSVLLKYLHPANYIDEKFKNSTKSDRLQNCIAYRQEVKTVKRKNQLVISLRHDDHADQELYAVKRWVKVETEGAEEHIFVEEDKEEPASVDVNTNGEETEAIDDVVFRARSRAEDIAMVRAMGLDVDDDNVPAPENIPENATDRTGEEGNVELGWGWSGIDHRKQLNISNVRAKISGITSDAMVHISFVGMFFLLFPKPLI